MLDITLKRNAQLEAQVKEKPFTTHKCKEGEVVRQPSKEGQCILNISLETRLQIFAVLLLILNVGGGGAVFFIRTVNQHWLRRSVIRQQV